MEDKEINWFQIVGFVGLGMGFMKLILTGHFL